MTLTQIGEQVVKGATRGIEGGDPQYEDYQRRINAWRESAGVAMNPRILRDHEVFEHNNRYRTWRSHYIYGAGDNFFLMDVQVRLSDPKYDQASCQYLTRDEARQLYAYLDEQLHPGPYRDAPGYAVLLDFAKAVMDAYADENDERMDDICWDFAPKLGREDARMLKADRDDLDDDPGDNIPLATTPSTEDQWADEALRNTSYPPPEIPQLRFGDVATIRQTVFAERNGRKIKAKTRVIKIEEIEGE